MITGTDWARVSDDLMMLSMEVDDYDNSMKIDMSGRRRRYSHLPRNRTWQPRQSAQVPLVPVTNYILLGCYRITRAPSDRDSCDAGFPQGSPNSPIPFLFFTLCKPRILGAGEKIYCGTGESSSC